MKALAVLCIGIVSSLNAATIAVIDSGVDYTHPQLKFNMWTNSSRNYGWNFAENNSKVFDPSIISTFSPDVKRYSEITSKSYVFGATDEEKAWAKEKQKENGFTGEVERFGNYVHGTHVAGIAMKGTAHKIMAIKLLATPVKATMNDDSKSNVRAPNGDPAKLLEGLLINLAVTNAGKMRNIGVYVKNNRADIANGSFGFGIYQAAAISHQAFKLVYKKEPTDAELVELAVNFMNMTILVNKSFVDASPETLFVFAAGNDGLNNDTIGASPANVKTDNTISVAATYKDILLAPFSNYGKEMVEVAAPGMLIESSIPRNDYLSVSGTSQAAPFVANVAGRIKDANRALKPVEIKKILMGTVDKKDFLKDKVASGGIVNAARAVYAANLSRQVSIEEAIERSIVAVVTRTLKRRNAIPVLLPKDVTPMPMPSPFEL